MAERQKTARKAKAKVNIKTRPLMRKSAALTWKDRIGTGVTDYFRFGESYTSLILGILVVVITSILLLSIVRNKAGTPLQQTSSTKTERTITETKLDSSKKTYTVKEGDSLWNIAMAEYRDGYKWTEIAKANNLANPGVINVGNELIIPRVERTALATTQVAGEVAPTPTAKAIDTTAQTRSTQVIGKITGSSYTVQRGDYLWEIAVRAYGDGYKWTNIAKANGLTNPDLIFSGNILKLPR